MKQRIKILCLAATLVAGGLLAVATLGQTQSEATRGELRSGVGQLELGRKIPLSTGSMAEIG